jgi:hypothetical protein
MGHSVKKVTWQTSIVDTLNSSVHKARKIEGRNISWTVQGANEVTSSSQRKVAWSSNMTAPAATRGSKDKKRVNRWASCN